MKSDDILWEILRLKVCHSSVFCADIDQLIFELSLQQFEKTLVRLPGTSCDSWKPANCRLSKEAKWGIRFKFSVANSVTAQCFLVLHLQKFYSNSNSDMNLMAHWCWYCLAIIHISLSDRWVSSIRHYSTWWRSRVFWILRRFPCFRVIKGTNEFKFDVFNVPAQNYNCLMAALAEVSDVSWTVRTM